MIYIAHRGFRLGVLENTLPAFRLAAALHMDYAELDVQLSRDGLLYVLHDTSLLRTMGVDRAVADLDSDEIDALQSSIGEGRIPRLETVIQELLVPPHKAMRLMVELKGPGTAKPCCDLIRRYCVEDRIVFSGRSLTRLQEAHNYIPEIPLCLNITKCPEFSLADFYRAENPVALPLPFAFISLKSDLVEDQSFPRQCHALNVAALSWNFVNCPDPVQRQIKLSRWGFDGLLFDDPASIPRFKQEHQL